MVRYAIILVTATLFVQSVANSQVSIFPFIEHFDSIPDSTLPSGWTTTANRRAAGDLILIRIVGSHFIWRMVRQVVGVLVEVGRGKLGEDDIRRILKEKSEIPSRVTAPPSGLFLESVIYGTDKPLTKLQPTMFIDSVRRRNTHNL